MLLKIYNISPNNGYWAFVGTLLAVVIGWSLNQFSSKKKDTREDKKILKESLFYLLELRYLITNLNVGKLLTIATTEILKKFPKELQNETSIDVVRKTLHPYLVLLIKETFLENENSLSSQYKAAIVKLSSVDPILAYRLSGKENVIRQVEKIKQEAINLVPNNSDEDAKIISAISTELDDKIFSDFLPLLDELIIEMASNIKTSYEDEVQVLLNKLEDNSQFVETIQPIIDKYIIPGIK